jgi:hypothetical protein
VIFQISPPKGIIKRYFQAQKCPKTASILPHFAQKGGFFLDFFIDIVSFSPPFTPKKDSVCLFGMAVH